MAKENKQPLNVKIDADMREELDRLKRDEALNVSAHVNRILRSHHFPKAKRARRAAIPLSNAARKGMVGE